VFLLLGRELALGLLDRELVEFELRLAFPLKVLADPAARDLFIDALKWFCDQAAASPSAAAESDTCRLIHPIL
jgi:hypothetical protein